MKLLIIADLHGNADVLNKLDSEFKAADIVLMAGDFADVIAKKSGEPVLKTLLDKHNEVYAVRGNHDAADFAQNLEDAGIYCESTLNHTGDVLIIGSGGATAFKGDTPFERTEDDIMEDFGILGEQPHSFPSLIIISHNPPYGCKCDEVAPGVHVGSKKFRTFIEEVQPLLVVTGHIHEATSIDKIGATTVINSGALGAAGTYATVETQKLGNTVILKSAELKKVD